MEARLIRRFVAAFLVLAALLLLTAFVSVAADAELAPGLTLIGSFLFRAFHWAGLFVPLFILTLAVLLFLSRPQPHLVLLANLFIVPFLTLAVSLRLLFPQEPFSALEQMLEKSFSAPGGGVLLLLAMVVELAAIPSAWRTLRHFFNLDEKGNYRKERAPTLYLPLLDPDSQLAKMATEKGTAGKEAAEVPAQGATLPVEQVPQAAEVPTAAEPRELTEIFPPDDEVLSVETAAVHQNTTPPAAPQEAADERDQIVPKPAGMLPGMPPEPTQDLEDEPLEVSILLDDDSEDEELTEVFADDEALQRSMASQPTGPVVTPREIVARKGRDYYVPVKGLLNPYNADQYWEIDDDTRRSAETLRTTLEEFNIKAEVTGIRKGPVVTMFELLPAPGVKLSRIVNLSDNIALGLAAQSVRIVAPIPGRQAVGIEVPNKRRATVAFAELVSNERFSEEKREIPIAVGKDISGEAQIMDLVQTPHLLIAGTTGSGKSVCVNSIICSILYHRSPEEVKLILIDPKIVELKFYNDIPHLLTPVITDPKRAFQALQYAVCEMERRYSLLDGVGVRDIRSFNRKIRAKALAAVALPYLVIVIDEFADLMATSGKDLESILARLAAMSRAVGIHLVLATQRPSIDVITGLIKANIPSRIAFMVANKIDSRIIMDASGAEKLLGRGDLLFVSSWDPFPVRMQGAFLSEEEVERVVEHVKTLGEPDYIDDEIFIDEDDDADLYSVDDDDPVLDSAVEIIMATGKASASYLQRRLKIGYNRAARIVETLERRGVLGPQNGSKPREILRSAQRE